MNDQELRNLLHEYAEPLRATPQRRPRTSTWRPLVWRFGLAGLATAAAMAAVVALPQIATARILHRVELALANVDTMRVETSMHFGDASKTATVFRAWYRRGSWRVENHPGRKFGKTYLLRDNTEVVYSPRDGTVTQGPLRQGTWNEGKTALEFAKRQTEIGLNEDRTVRLVRGLTHGGRPAYEIVMDRAKDAYHAEILVDEATNLPISSDTAVTYDHRYAGTNDRAYVHVDYRFGEPLGNEMFDARRFGPPVIDLPTTQARLATQLDRGSPGIADAAVNPDGTVYLVGVVSYPLPDSGRTPEMPESLNDDAGTRYLRLRDMWPGDDQNAFRPRKGAFVIATYVPLEPSRANIGSLLARFGKRSPERLQPRRLTGEVPEYSTALALNDSFRQQRIEAAKRRAEQYHALNDYESELGWRWKQYNAAVDYIPRFGELQAKDLAACLDALGRKEEAERVRKNLGPQLIKRYP